MFNAGHKYNNSLYFLGLFVCLVVSVILKVYDLPNTPYGLHIDEAGMAYDAWCLANFGVDRWLNAYPIYLINFGGGQSALLAYLTALMIKLNGGMSVWCIRLPSVIVSTIAYVAGYYIMFRLYGKKWAMLGIALFTLMPYFIMQCRFGLDCNLLVNVTTIAMALTMLATERQKVWLFFLAGLVWALSFYCYVLGWISNCIVILLIAILIYTKNEKAIKPLCYFLGPIILLAFPLLAMLLVNILNLQQYQILGLTVPKLLFYRGNEFTFTTREIINNIPAVIRAIFLKDNLHYNVLPGYYAFYPFSVIFVGLGFLHYIKMTINDIHSNDMKWQNIWLTMFMCYCILGCFLRSQGANCNKLNGIFFVSFIMLISGLKELYEDARKKKVIIAKVGLCCIGLLYVCYFRSFTSFYFNNYKEYACQGENILFYDLIPPMIVNEDYQLLGDKIYLDIPIGTNIYFCLSALVNPYDFNYQPTEKKFYKNYYFWLPEKFVKNSIYVVRKSNGEYLDKLEREHISRFENSKNYYIYKY